MDPHGAVNQTEDARADTPAAAILLLAPVAGDHLPGILTEKLIDMLRAICLAGGAMTVGRTHRKKMNAEELTS